MSEDKFLGNLYQRFPVTIEKGLGAHVWDTEGKEYIDCMGGYGVALLGHQNERVTNALKAHLKKLLQFIVHFTVRLVKNFWKIFSKLLQKICHRFI